MVSIYLNYGDPKKQPEGWHVCAQFALAISNPHDGTCYIQSRGFRVSILVLAVYRIETQEHL